MATSPSYTASYCLQARTGGLIGELPYGSGQRGYQVPPNYGQRYNQPLLGYGEQTQRVAKLRIGGNDAAGSSSQLSVYRNETPVYAQASAVNQVILSLNNELTSSLPVRLLTSLGLGFPSAPSS